MRIQTQLPAIREVECKSVLSKSKLSDYTVNCYTGCLHACVYCYARYMKRFSGHGEPWGKFVDVKVNSPDVLERELKRAEPGRVIMSSVCDGWQPLEREYEVSRRCLTLLLRYGFHVTILTKSSFIRDDLDILEGADVELGMTLTTMDNALCSKIEPGASPTSERIDTLREAADRGIKIWAFLGPFMPFLSDSAENIESLFKALSDLKLEHIYADKLNPRPGVWRSIKAFLGEHYPYLIGSYGRILYNKTERESYKQALGKLIVECAKKYGREEDLRIMF
jgi:DNA repair photolyase